MVARMVCLVVAVLGSAAAAESATAGGGHYGFVGGTGAERAQVRAALDASLFDWDAVPAQITIRIAPGLAPSATAGTIELDAGLLDAGRFAWGVVQHEFAHQVDFFLLDDAMRSRLAACLGGESWWQTPGGLAHRALTSERFASTLAWVYWPSPDNVVRPISTADGTGTISPLRFRALLRSLLGVSASARVR
jgi:hypothetical protein